MPRRMKDGKDNDGIGSDDVKDAIGKTPREDAPDMRTFSQA